MRNSHLIAAMVAGMALCASPGAIEERPSKELKAPPPPPPPEPKPVAKNLPGETNRQFAARMKAEAARSEERRAGE